MHFSLTPWRRFPGHSLPLSVLKSRSRLSVVRASLTARSPGTIFRSSRLRARRQFFRGITGCPRLNRLALFADPSCGEEHRALGPGMESKGRAIGLREPQRGSLIPPIEGQTGVGHQLVGSEPGRLLPCKDRGGIPPIRYMVCAAGGDTIRCAPYLLAHHGMIAVGDSLRGAM